MINMLYLINRFRFSGDFDLKDKERPGQPNKIEDEDLDALLDEDGCQTIKQLSDTLNVTEMTGSQSTPNVMTN